MDRGLTPHLHCINSVNARNQRVGILLKVLKVPFLEPVSEERHLFLCHRFDHKSLVVREEEKAATGARCLACLENVVAVLLWGQRFKNDIPGNSALASQLSKLSIQPGVDVNLPVDGKLGLFLHELGDVGLEREVLIHSELLLAEVLPGLEIRDDNFVKRAVQCRLIVYKPVSVGFQIRTFFDGVADGFEDHINKLDVQR